MKTITKKIDLYEYHELSDEAKEKARRSWIESNDYPMLTEDLQEGLIELLKENKITVAEGTTPKVMYSLGYCQGDGAMFEGVFNWKQYTVHIKHSGHYYHYNSKTIEMESEEMQGTGINEGNDKDEEEFNEIYVSIAQKLAKYGYAHIEQEDSEENFSDMCECNVYTFTSDGKMYNA